MLVWVLMICVIMMMFHDPDKPEHIHVLGYSPKYFYVSNGESNKMFEKLKRNGIMDESLKYLVRSGHEVSVAIYPKKVVMWDQAKKALEQGDKRDKASRITLIS